MSERECDELIKALRATLSRMVMYEQFYTMLRSMESMVGPYDRKAFEELAERVAKRAEDEATYLEGYLKRLPKVCR